MPRPARQCGAETHPLAHTLKNASNARMLRESRIKCMSRNWDSERAPLVYACMHDGDGDVDIYEACSIPDVGRIIAELFLGHYSPVFDFLINRTRYTMGYTMLYVYIVCPHSQELTMAATAGT